MGEVDGVVHEVRDVAERLGIAEATGDLYEQSTGKGFDFEEAVDTCASRQDRGALRAVAS